MSLSTLRHYPTTLTIAAISLFAFAFPSLSQQLQLDFNLVQEGEWWRVWTGHMTHYGGGHLFWDLLMFVALGAACEKNHSSRFAPALALMAVGISATIGLCCNEIDTYRGLSGLDTGLFVWFVTDQARRCWRATERLSAAFWLMPCLGLVGKLIFEAVTGQTLFVDSSHFTPLVESHLAGAMIGLLFTVGGIIAASRPGRTSQSLAMEV